MPRLQARAALLLAGVLLALGSPADGVADPAGTLRTERAALAAREHSALLQLYALETRLASLDSQLASLRERAGSLARQRAVVRLRLRSARLTLRAAQRSLGRQLRLLYEYERPDVLAVVLGASSIDDAITSFDALERTTRATSGVVTSARKARRDVGKLARALALRATELGRLQGKARARAAELGTAREERAAYVVSLREEQQLKSAQISSLERSAREAQAQASAATAEGSASTSVTSFAARAATAPPAPAATPEPAKAQARPGSGRTITVVSTAYALPGTTATGLPVGYGIVAVDPNVIPLGTRMTIPGYGEGVAADTGGAIKGARIDVWLPTRQQALDWGWKTVTITLH